MSTDRRVGLVSILAMCLGITASSGATPKIYWTEYGPSQVKRANIDGTQVEVVVDAPDHGGILAVTVSPVAGRLYWSQWSAPGGRLMWGKLDGTGREELGGTWIASPRGIAVDVAGAVLYYAQPTDCPGCGQILRTDLDGANSVNLLPSLDSPIALALDLPAGKLYWSDDYSNTIFVADLEGLGRQTVLEDTRSYGLAVDAVAGKLYWTDWNDNCVRRANLDGSEVEDLVAGQNEPRGIVLDTSRGKMYWADTGANTIRVADLDGSETAEVVSGLDRPFGVALDLGEGEILLTLEADQLGWTVPVGALGYDVIRGNLFTLRRSGGDFAAATETCVTENVFPASVATSWQTLPGEGQWFLVRGVTATGDGTYESFGPAQAARRDSSIAGSGFDCLVNP